MQIPNRVVYNALILLITFLVPSLALGGDIRFEKESETTTIVLAKTYRKYSSATRILWEPAGKIIYSTENNGKLYDNNGKLLCSFKYNGREYEFYNRENIIFGTDDNLLGLCASYFKNEEPTFRPTAPPPEFAGESNFGEITVVLRNKDSNAYNDWKIWIDGKLAGYIYEFLPPNSLNVPYGEHTIEVGYGFEEQGLKQIHKTYRVNISSRTGNGVLRIPD